MHGFLPGLFWFGPAILFLGFFKLLFFVLIIWLIVRLVSHGSRHAAYAHGDPWHGYGHGPHVGFDGDPRRLAAMRYAAGKIDRAEFDRIMAGLDANSPSNPPAAPPAQ